MSTTPDDGRAVRRARIESVLAQYPNVDAQSVDDVLHWFRKEASSLDVALLASNQEIAEAYRRFRTDHVEPLTRGHSLRSVTFTAVALAIIVAMVWQAIA